MSSLIIGKMLLADAVQSSGSGSPDNVLTPSPKEVISLVGGGNASIAIDMGEAVEINSVFVGFIDGGDPVSFNFYRNDALAGANVETVFSNAEFVKGDAGDYRRHAWAFDPVATFTSRYWKLTLNLTGQPDTTIGIFALAKAVQPANGREWGSGRQPVDLSNVNALIGGGFGIERGARKALWSFTCPDLSEAEISDLWDIMLDVGESAPALAIEDPDAGGDESSRAHYGLMQRPEAFERTHPFNSRWTFRILEWV